jgi:excisionase family DNA binding protein
MADRLAAAVAELVEALRDELRQADAQPTPDRLLSIPDAADALGVGRTLVYTLIARGELRSVKLGKRRLVPSSAIAAWAPARNAPMNEFIRAAARKPRRLQSTGEGNESSET